MSGYNGWAMSNNAVAAYEDGEKPLSKWTKADIFKEIEEQEVKIQCSMEILQKVPLRVLKDTCLKCSSWHHTSKYYNETDFYVLDIDALEELTNEKARNLLAAYQLNKKARPNVRPVEEKWKCAFLEWSGSRKHPKATEIVEEGIVKGNWFYRADGSKKSVKANGFRFIEKI